MRVDLLTREFPPHVYGGAGVHVENLAHHLRPHLDLRVHCFADAHESEGLVCHPVTADFADANPAMQALSVSVSMANAVQGASLVHSHTWYTNFAGQTASILYGIPHVVTAHSLEPRRPWKAEQLGRGYQLSTSLERDALIRADKIIAVSHAMAADLTETYPQIDAGRVAVVHNGIDTTHYAPDPHTDELERLGIRTDREIVACVARITPQKGLRHLLHVAEALPPDVQLVIVAEASDTLQQRREFGKAVAGLRARGSGVLWISRPLRRRALIQLLSHAAAFVCPSVYEPLGIVNLEAMACGAPVVASATGGIPEVVDDGETGFLVPLEVEPGSRGEPRNPEVFAKEFAARINTLLSDRELAARMGEAGRRRAVSQFSWAEMAGRVRKLYAEVS
ncbi:glycogen synthase [Streptomyces sp. NPDC058092]|uniref:glycogen synthase n=1 Tax=Streptomyces sp. NPDC058092 TaxID=3346336 RepID=UPI0036EBF2AD